MFRWNCLFDYGVCGCWWFVLFCCFVLLWLFWFICLVFVSFLILCFVFEFGFVWFVYLVIRLDDWLDLALFDCFGVLFVLFYFCFVGGGFLCDWLFCGCLCTCWFDCFWWFFCVWCLNLLYVCVYFVLDVFVVRFFDDLLFVCFTDF